MLSIYNARMLFHQLGLAYLIEEKEKLRSASQFDSDRDTFPGFDAETESGEPNHSVGDVFHLKELDDLFNLLT
jgi:hypothetical protein